MQGVGCRAQVQEVVESIGHLTGWVKNLESGDVEVVLKGPDWRLKDVEEIFKRGMMTPVVINSVTSEALPPEFTAKGFLILR